MWKGCQVSDGWLWALCYDGFVMTTSAVGVDIIEIERVERVLKRWGNRFLARVYTPLEVAFCRGRSSELAARFAAKEAVMKALGTGARGLAWREIEVLPNHRGKPLVYLHGRAFARAQRISMSALDISLSHSRDYAVAFVVGQSHDLEPDRAAWRDEFTRILRERGALRD